MALVLIIESSIMTVSCRPNDSHGNHHHRHQHRPAVQLEEVDVSSEYSDLTPMEFDGIKKCQADEDMMELCMRCVKATKARNVYPMCCLNEDKVGDWCRDFVYFGIQ